MTRLLATTIYGACAGFIVAMLASAAAQWPALRHPGLLDSGVRILMPMSGGLRTLAQYTDQGRFVRGFCALNAVLYGFVGFVIGIILQFVRPTIERPLD